MFLLDSKTSILSSCLQPSAKTHLIFFHRLQRNKNKVELGSRRAAAFLEDMLVPFVTS